MERYFVSKSDWESFVSRLTQSFEVYAPVESEKDLFFKKIAPPDVPGIVWDKYRTVQPAKQFVNPFLEEVVSKKEPSVKKIVVMGLRNCDLAAFDLLDKIFESGGCSDPFYQARRQNIILAGADCTDARDSCFCSIWGLTPFPAKNFDISIAQVKDGFVLEAANQVGRSLLIKGDLATSVLDEYKLAERQTLRNAVMEKLNKVNKDYHLFVNDNADLDSRAGLLKGTEESPVWDEHSKTCVTCGACTQVCPTCHCFFLAELKGWDFLKNKYWDSCQFTGYGRVAGGANPRNKIAERLSNRYFCKLVNRPLAYDAVLGCTGCGRCIEACQGNIDIRKALKDIKSAGAAVK